MLQWWTGLVSGLACCAMIDLTAENRKTRAWWWWGAGKLASWQSCGQLAGAPIRSRQTDHSSENPTSSGHNLSGDQQQESKQESYNVNSDEGSNVILG